MLWELSNTQAPLFSQGGGVVLWEGPMFGCSVYNTSWLATTTMHDSQFNNPKPNIRLIGKHMSPTWRIICPDWSTQTVELDDWLVLELHHDAELWLDVTVALALVRQLLQQSLDSARSPVVGPSVHLAVVALRWYATYTKNVVEPCFAWNFKTKQI